MQQLPRNGYITHSPDRFGTTPALIFDDADKFEQKIDEYFESISQRHEQIEEYEDIDKNGDVVTKYRKSGKYEITWIKPPTMVGMGVYFDCNYRLFRDYADGMFLDHPQMTPELHKRIRNAVYRAEQLCHEYTLDRVFLAKSANGPIFILKTIYRDHGYVEEININQKVTRQQEELLSLDRLSTDRLRDLKSLLTEAKLDKQHQFSKQSAVEADFEDVK